VTLKKNVKFVTVIFLEYNNLVITQNLQLYTQPHRIWYDDIS